MAKFMDTGSKAEPAAKKSSSGKHRVRKTMDTAFMVIYRMRKLFLALPVMYYAFKIAFYNEEHLPVEVGLFLQNNGNFLRMIDRNTAVLFPLIITLACLCLMMFSKKAMYAWAISIFSLALPLLLLISNIYPA